jgi:hypothetical protein
VITHSQVSVTEGDDYGLSMRRYMAWCKACPWTGTIFEVWGDAAYEGQRHMFKGNPDIRQIGG